MIECNLHASIASFRIFRFKALLETFRPSIEMFGFPTILLALLSCTLTAPLATSDPIPVVIRDLSISLSFSRQLNLTSGHTLYQRDLDRAVALKGRSDFEAGSNRAVVSTPADNELVSYIAHVGVGSPPTQCRIIDYMKLQWT